MMALNDIAWNNYRKRNGLHDFTDWTQYTMALVHALKSSLETVSTDMEQVRKQVAELIELFDVKPYYETVGDA